MTPTLHKILATVALVAAFAGFLSCSKDDGREQETELSLTLKTTSATRSAGSCFVAVTAPGAWNLGFSSDTVKWARLSQSEGSGSKSNIVLDWDTNSGEQSRSLTLTLKSGDALKTAAFIQAGVGSPEMSPDPVGKWMELPETNTPGLYFIHHPMTIGALNTRNYSYYWSPENLVAIWVAYPLNQTLMSGSSGRTDQWGLDPKVPRKLQPVLYSAFRGYGVRGHQLPSADRQQRAYNIETFYGTNMTPQNYDLNGGVWAGLESYVRDRARMVDTLYVVTGCTIEGSSSKSYDNDGKAVTVPTGYFKALLAYKKAKGIGITGQTNGYTGVAFYFENKDYSGSYLTQAMTIDALETKTGLNFFVNLPDAIGSDKNNKVKTTKDTWWYTTQ